MTVIISLTLIVIVLVAVISLSGGAAKLHAVKNAIVAIKNSISGFLKSMSKSSDGEKKSGYYTIIPKNDEKPDSLPGKPETGDATIPFSEGENDEEETKPYCQYANIKIIYSDSLKTYCNKKVKLAAQDQIVIGRGPDRINNLEKIELPNDKLHTGRIQCSIACNGSDIFVCEGQSKNPTLLYTDSRKRVPIRDRYIVKSLTWFIIGDFFMGVEPSTESAYEGICGDPIDQEKTKVYIPNKRDA